MLEDLKAALYLAVREVIPEKDVAVAFSGGVDSSLLAKICKDLGKDVVLVTVGFPGSHDIAFSKAMSAKLGLRQQVAEINAHDFFRDLARVRTVACGNTSHIENCVAYHYIAGAAREAGINVVASANGCDELFCGYSGYRAVFEKGEAAVNKFMETKIANELELVQEISAVAHKLGVEVRQPFLSQRFIEYAVTVPLDQKIRGSDDLVRKHALRRVALEIGVPEESALKQKKALQYGTSIHKNFKKQARA